MTKQRREAAAHHAMAMVGGFFGIYALTIRSETFGSSETVQLKVKGTDSPAVWSSANTAVATVSESGLVKWAGKGTTTVTATVDGQTLECIVRGK